MTAAFVVTEPADPSPDRLSRHANRDRLANLLIRLEEAPSMAWIHVLHAEGQARPVHLVIDGETHALSREEADDIAAALFADPMILTDAAGLAARLMETALDAWVI